MHWLLHSLHYLDAPDLRTDRCIAPPCNPFHYLVDAGLTHAQDAKFEQLAKAVAEMKDMQVQDQLKAELAARKLKYSVTNASVIGGDILDRLSGLNQKRTEEILGRLLRSELPSVLDSPFRHKWAHATNEEQLQVIRVHGMSGSSSMRTACLAAHRACVCLAQPAFIHAQVLAVSALESMGSEHEVLDTHKEHYYKMPTAKIDIALSASKRVGGQGYVQQLLTGTTGSMEGHTLWFSAASLPRRHSPTLAPLVKQLTRRNPLGSSFFLLGGTGRGFWCLQCGRQLVFPSISGKLSSTLQAPKSWRPMVSHGLESSWLLLAACKLHLMSGSVFVLLPWPLPPGANICRHAILCDCLQACWATLVAPLELKLMLSNNATGYKDALGQVTCHGATLSLVMCDGLMLVSHISLSRTIYGS